MPIRFSTEAANADVMGDLPQTAALPADTPQAAEPETKGHARKGQSDAGSEVIEAKPGKDINVAGFVKDRDSYTP